MLVFAKRGDLYGAFAFSAYGFVFFLYQNLLVLRIGIAVNPESKEIFVLFD